MSHSPKVFDLGDIPVERDAQRWLMIFILDTSISMTENRVKGVPPAIDQLNKALSQWMKSGLFPTNAVAQACGEFAVISFKDYDAKLLHMDSAGAFSQTTTAGETWSRVKDVRPFAADLKASALTPLWKAINMAIEIDRERKQLHGEAGREIVARTLLYIITDGANSDSRGAVDVTMSEYIDAKARLNDAKQNSSVRVYGLGVTPHDQDELTAIASEGCYHDLSVDLNQLVEILNRSVNENSVKSDADSMGSGRGAEMGAYSNEFFSDWESD
jgi:uncharacterized protein YegL